MLSQSIACNVGDLGSIFGSGRSPGGGNGNPFQYSGESNGQRSLVQATVHRVAKSRTRLSTSLFLRADKLEDKFSEAYCLIRVLVYNKV